MGIKAADSTGPGLQVASGTPPADRGDLQRWIDESRAVLTSSAFADNLRSLAADYSEIWLSPRLQYASPSELADRLAGKGDGYRFVSTPVTLTGDARDDTAHAGYAGVGPDGRTGLSSMTLGRLHLSRYRSSDLVEKSCAINTMVHETSHTLTNTSPAFLHAIEDTGNAAAPANSTAPLASYLIGAVAQCTYLQQRGRVTAGGLRACVAVFGTNNYNSARCNQFGNGQVVEERPGLPDPAPPIRG
jgi:hypothetical protein